MHIYPENLKSAPTLGFWQLKDIVIGGFAAVLGAITLVYGGSYLFVAVAALYFFLTIRFDDACILDFLRKAVVYFILKPQSYRWARITVHQEVTNHQKDRIQRKEKPASKQGHPRAPERQGHHRTQSRHPARG